MGQLLAEEGLRCFPGEIQVQVSRMELEVLVWTDVGVIIWR